MTHLTAALNGGIIFAILVAVALFLAERTTAGEAEAKKLKAAASREFEGAKPAIIHAADTTIDKLPENIDIAALEAKAEVALAALFTRLLAGNPILSGSATLLLGLIPLAFKSLPTTIDVSSYKDRLKDEVQTLIKEARL